MWVRLSKAQRARAFLLSCALMLAVAASAHAQQPTFAMSSANCAKSPQQGNAIWCFDNVTHQMFYWSGSAFTASPPGTSCSHTGTPVVTNCGTSPSIAGTDCVGILTVGGSYTGAGGGCKVTFASAFSNTPLCLGWITATGGAVSSMAGALSPLAFTVTTSSFTDVGFTLASAEVVSYFCPSY
jgi:hypothetical protein